MVVFIVSCMLASSFMSVGMYCWLSNLLEARQIVREAGGPWPPS